MGGARSVRGTERTGANPAAAGVLRWPCAQNTLRLMYFPGAKFHRLLALALLAWIGMLFAPPLTAMQSAPTLVGTQAAPMRHHAGPPMATCCVDVGVAGHDACGHAHSACADGCCCGCAGVCAAAVLPMTARSLQMPRAGHALPRRFRSTLVSGFGTPPLRPPAV